MQHFMQDERSAQAWSMHQTRRSANAANTVEYGLMALLLATLIATGATLMGNRLSGLFSTVAFAMEQSGEPRSTVPFAQGTDR
jgi:Flp pilus assembly pilin Flp